MARLDPPDTSYAPFDDPASDHPIHYGRGLATFPVDPDTVTPVSAEQAIATVIANGIFSSDRLSPRRATLRMVSVGFDDKDASFAPHLGWVVTRRGPGRPGGGGKRQQRAGSDRATAPLDCIFVSVVNATSGAIDGHHHRICGPPTPTS